MVGQTHPSVYILPKDRFRPQKKKAHLLRIVKLEGPHLALATGQVGLTTVGVKVSAPQVSIFYNWFGNANPNPELTGSVQLGLMGRPGIAVPLTCCICNA